MRRYKVRRTIGLLAALVVIVIGIYNHESFYEAPNDPSVLSETSLQQLETLLVKGRAPKTNYARSQFGDGWTRQFNCDTRNIILNRDLKHVDVGDSCQVESGVLEDPYTGKTISFQRGSATSQAVQIDHVVPLSNAWQTGAQLLSMDKRILFANDPLNLLAVDGTANQQKSDSDAATWLPSHKAFRCQYVARQIQVKATYHLWVTSAERAAMERVLQRC